MAQQHLDGAQVGAGLQQVGGEAVPQRVRVELFANAGAFGGFPAGVPNDFGVDRGIGAVPAAAWKQPLGRLPGQSAIVLSKFFE